MRILTALDDGYVLSHGPFAQVEKQCVVISLSSAVHLKRDVLDFHTVQEIGLSYSCVLSLRRLSAYINSIFSFRKIVRVYQCACTFKLRRRNDFVHRQDFRPLTCFRASGRSTGPVFA